MASNEPGDAAMLHDEAVLTFSEAAKYLPPLNGRRVHSSTLWRWARRGCKGVRLEVQRLGGRFYTSKQALERFATAMAEIDIPERPAPTPQPKNPTERQRQRSIQNANCVLRAGGIL